MPPEKKKSSEFHFNKLTPLTAVKAGDLLAPVLKGYRRPGWAQYRWGGVLYPVQSVAKKRLKVLGRWVDRQSAQEVTSSATGWVVPTPEMLECLRVQQEEKASEEAERDAQRAAQAAFDATEEGQLAHRIRALDARELTQRLTIPQMKRILREE